MKWKYDKKFKEHFTTEPSCVYEITKTDNNEFKLLKHQITIGWFSKLKDAKYVAELIEKG